MNALQLQKLENVNFTHFFTRPLGENYSNSYFDKSKGLNNQETKKMKSIFSNHIFEPTLSNHFLQIDVDLIEKLIPCSLQGGPFGGPACPPVQEVMYFEIITKKLPPIVIILVIILILILVFIYIEICRGSITNLSY